MSRNKGKNRTKEEIIKDYLEKDNKINDLFELIVKNNIEIKELKEKLKLSI